MGKNFEHLGRPEDTENVEKAKTFENPDGKEKENMFTKMKNFFGFGEHLASKENGEKEDGKDKGTEVDRHQAFVDRLREGVSQGGDAEIAKKYREEHGLDDHGNKIDKGTEKKTDDTDTDDDVFEAEGDMDRTIDTPKKDAGKDKDFDLDM